MEEIVKLYKIRGKIRCYIVKESNGKFRTCTGKPSDRSSICWTYDNLEDAIETAEEFVENYNSLSLSSFSVEAEDWLKDVKVDPKNKTPEGLFTKPASTIVRELLKLTKNDIGKAIQKITFYINRAGDNLSNANEVEKAKEQLQKKNELKHEKEESKVMAKSRFDVDKHQVPEDPQINLEFVRLSKDDKGYEDPKYYYFNDTVQNPEIWERFKKFIEKKWDMGYLDRQVSTSKKTAICPEAEAFIESISDYPHKTYFGDGLFGIWVFELPVKGRGKLPFLQFENPFSPFSRIICIHDNEDLKALNEELAKWKEKNGKTKVESSVKRNKEMKVLSRLKICSDIPKNILPDVIIPPYKIWVVDDSSWLSSVNWEITSTYSYLLTVGKERFVGESNNLKRVSLKALERLLEHLGRKNTKGSKVIKILQNAKFNKRTDASYYIKDAIENFIFWFPKEDYKKPLDLDYVWDFFDKEGR